MNRRSILKIGSAVSLAGGFGVGLVSPAAYKIVPLPGRVYPASFLRKIETARFSSRLKALRFVRNKNLKFAIDYVA